MKESDLPKLAMVIDDVFFIEGMGVIITGQKGEDWDRISASPYIKIHHEGEIARFEVRDVESFRSLTYPTIPSPVGGIVLNCKDKSLFHKGDVVTI